MQEEQGIWKYLARSFLLPMAGLVMTFILAYRTSPDQWDKLVYPGTLMAAFAGIFNLSEAYKTVRLPVQGGTQPPSGGQV